MRNQYTVPGTRGIRRVTRACIDAKVYCASLCASPTASDACAPLRLPALTHTTARRWTTRAWWLIVLLSWLPGACLALADDPWRAQREQFLAAERALRQDRRAEYQARLDNLRSYPLFPYLLYADVSRRLARVDNATVQSLLGELVETPLAWQLRRAWLRHLGRQHRWSDYVQFYTPMRDARLQCDYLNALLHAGKKDKALSLVEPLWLSARSQPDECDPVFTAWRQAGHLDAKLVWQRLSLAMNAGQGKLAGYLIRFLPPEDRPLARLWLEVLKRPGLVAQPSLFARGTERAGEILIWGLERLARRDPGKAGTVWRKLRAAHRFSDADTARAHKAIGLGFAYKLKPEAVEWLAAVGEEHADARVREWRILSAMRQKQWQRALQWLDALDETQQRDERWQYWRARCLQEIGDTAGATARYRLLASQRNYYGFMAADQLGLPYRFNDKPFGFSSAELRPILDMPGVVRAGELYRLGRWIDARREWNLAISELSEADLVQAAAVAHRWGWHGRAIITVARTPRRDDLALRFPAPYLGIVTHEAQARDLDRAWVFAIARQESAFMPDARSPKGALGLMQILPSTGLHIAHSLNVHKFKSRVLLDADTNIRFGSYYLRRLLDRMNGNPILATAAYNAGPNRIRDWLPAEGALPADLWIDTVPYAETRGYIRRVFSYTAVYEMRLGEPAIRLSDRFSPISAPPGS